MTNSIISNCSKKVVFPSQRGLSYNEIHHDYLDKAQSLVDLLLDAGIPDGNGSQLRIHQWMVVVSDLMMLARDIHPRQ